MHPVTGVLVFTILASASSDRHHRNVSFVETVKEIIHDSRRDSIEHVSEDIAVMGAKVKDGMVEFIDDSFDYYLDGEDNSTESNSTKTLGMDSTGCNQSLRIELEDKCDAEYDRVNEESQQIEDEKKKKEAVCCALEDFEKCYLRAFDKANCAADRTSLKQSLKAARLFLSVVTNITCNSFRGRCAYYASDAVGSSFGFAHLLLMSATSLLAMLF